MYNNLLIVDDEITTAFCLKDVVAWNSYGLTVTGVFKSAAEALKHIETHKVDVIFSDIRYTAISATINTRRMLTVTVLDI